MSKIALEIADDIPPFNLINESQDGRHKVILKFTSETPSKSIRLRRNDDELLLQTQEGHSILKIPNFFAINPAQKDSKRHSIQAIAFDDGTHWNHSEIKTRVQLGSDQDDILLSYPEGSLLEGLEGSDTLYGDIGPDVLKGGPGDDDLFGKQGNDFLGGGPGNNTLYGGDDDDILRSGPDQNYLYGGSGNDTYLISKNDGLAMIVNDDHAENRRDILKFSQGILPEDVHIGRTMQDLSVKINNTKVHVRIIDFFEPYNRPTIDAIEFHDGTLWTQKEMLSRVLRGTDGSDKLYAYAEGFQALEGLAGNDILYGHKNADFLSGGPGKDQLYGSAGDDSLHGGEGRDYLHGGQQDDHLYGEAGNDALEGDLGNDYLYGGADDDTLRGGAGLDFLDGGKGNDRYLVGYGDGHNIINNYDEGDHSQQDVLILEASITMADLQFYRHDDNLVLALISDKTQVTVLNWFRDSAYQLDAIEVSQQRLTQETIARLVRAMAEFDGDSSEEISPATLLQSLGDVQSHWVEAL